MTYRLRPNRSLQKEIRRVAREQILGALSDLDTPEPAAAVHRVRRRCKKIRGLIRLIRPDLRQAGAENDAIRTIARRLSALRDRTARAECLEQLATHGADPAVIASAIAIIPGEPDTDTLTAALRDTRGDLLEALERVGTWKLRKDRAGRRGDAARRGLIRAYQAARTAMEAAATTADPEAWHEWRKRVKDMHFQVRLLAALRPKRMRRLRDGTKTLGDLLGDEHDLEVLRALVVREPARFERGGALVDAIDARREALRAEALRQGRTLFAARPKRFASRVRIAA